MEAGPWNPLQLQAIYSPEGQCLQDIYSPEGQCLQEHHASSYLYGFKCWPVTIKHKQALHVTKMCALWWALGLRWLEHVMNEDVQRVMGVGPKTEKMTEAYLRWYGDHAQQ